MGRAGPLDSPLLVPVGGDSSEAKAAEPQPRLTAIVVEILTLAVPTTFGFLLDLINEVTNAIFIGRTGTDAELAAVGMGNMIQNCVGLYVGIGLVAALEPLVSQAVGAEQFELCSHYLQQARVVASTQMLWMAPVLWFSGDILLAIGQDPDVSRYAGDYNRASVFGLWSFFQLEANRQFLMQHSITVAPMLIMGACSLLHIVWCTLFVVHLGWGNSGVGWANTTTWTLAFAMCSVYLLFKAPELGYRRRALLLVGKDGLKGLSAFYAVAVPMMLGLCSEWWFWELTALMVGYLGKVPLAAHVTVMNLLGVLLTPNLGVQTAAATLVGNMLGASRPQMAKHYCWVSAFLAAFSWCIGASALFFGGPALAHLYTDQEDVAVLAVSLMHIQALVGFCDTFSKGLSAVAQCVGYQRFAALFYILVYFGFMMPLCAGLAFGWHWGVKGVWWSFFVGTALAALIFAIKMAMADWPQLAKQALERVEGATSPITPPKLSA